MMTRMTSSFAWLNSRGRGETRGHACDFEAIDNQCRVCPSCAASW